MNHPNVVTLYDFGQADGQPYLVMELVEGGSLAARLAGKPADAAWAALHVEQLARAVHHLHERKIIHRDLKPANVLLAGDGTPKISDFGLAKWLANNDPGVTETFAVLGTACYMSPEQARRFQVCRPCVRCLRSWRHPLRVPDRPAALPRGHLRAHDRAVARRRPAPPR